MVTDSDALFCGGSVVAAEFSCSRIKNVNSAYEVDALYISREP
jgi:hypothetical protein